MAAGWYEGFAPLFEYTAKKFNPDSDVRVFFKRDLFPDHPDNATSILRFCVPNKYFKGYDYVYFSDVDFLFLPQTPTLFDYNINAMSNSNACYAGLRGRMMKDKQPVWDGTQTRIVAAMFMASWNWFVRTEKQREFYVEHSRKGLKYREKDEVYLFKICRDSSLPTPTKVFHFVSGEKYDMKYRMIHLGDFSKNHRWTKINKMKRKFLIDHNIHEYKKHLMADPGFLSIVEKTRNNPQVHDTIKNLREHIRMRNV